MSDIKIKTPVDNDRFAEEIGARLTAVSEGYAKAEMTIEERHLNGLRLGHGGAIFTLADLAFAASCNSYGIDAVAVTATISYFKAAKEGMHLTAESKEVSKSRKLGTYNITVVDDKGEQIAAMTGTAFRKTPPRTA